MDEPDTLSKAIGAYLRDCERRGLRPATVRSYDTALRRFTRSTSLVDLDDFTRGSVRAFQDSTHGLAGVSMRGYLRALRTFSTWLSDEAMTSGDRLAGLRLPRVDVRLRVVPTDTELTVLMSSAATSLRVVIALLAGTGLRISDVTSLDVSDFRGGDLIVRTTKNRHGRLLPLDGVLGPLLATYVNDCRPQPADLDGRALFINRLGHRLTAGGARQALDAAKRRADLSIEVSPHALRHWYARDLTSHGTSDRLLRARMGWTSSSLESRYAPVTDAELRADVERYAPLMRLQVAGLLDGILPIGRSGRGPICATARSKRLTGVTATTRPPVARRS